MEINVLIDEGFEGCPEAGWLQRVAERVLIAQNAVPSVELGLVITTQERVQQLNLSYLGRAAPTDVLAFSTVEEIGTDLPRFVTPPDGVLHLGEVIVSYPQAVIQAKKHRHSIEKEITILIIHGILHLLGYEHDRPGLKRLMSAREKEILSYIEGEPK